MIFIYDHNVTYFVSDDCSFSDILPCIYVQSHFDDYRKRGHQMLPQDVVRVIIRVTAAEYFLVYILI